MAAKFCHEKYTQLAVEKTARVRWVFHTRDYEKRSNSVKDEQLSELKFKRVRR